MQRQRRAVSTSAAVAAIIIVSAVGIGLGGVLYGATLTGKTTNETGIGGKAPYVMARRW